MWTRNHRGPISSGRRVVWGTFAPATRTVAAISAMRRLISWTEAKKVGGAQFLARTRPIPTSSRASPLPAVRGHALADTTLKHVESRDKGYKVTDGGMYAVEKPPGGDHDGGVQASSLLSDGRYLGSGGR